MITYRSDLAGLSPDQLEGGFFDGWPNRPDPAAHLDVLRGSSRVVLAIDEETAMVVGFITAVSDGVLAAYIPFLEVLPFYRGRGIGSELVRLLLEELGDLYMVDVICDPDLQPFYAHLGLQTAAGMVLRNRGAIPG